MELHRLELQAIGPFPGSHAIDFDSLSRAGLFLLEGPTGAGKSTVIDAITFALYGQVAGADSSNERVRSTHADPMVESRVALTFSTRRGSYRVVRTPAYRRAKLRGSGTTEQHETTKLFRLTSPADPIGDLISDRGQEVGAEIGEILGLSRDQFAKTVVLAQGEFAAFLHATSEERRPLLQKVFGTQEYADWEKRIAEMRREANQRLEAARNELSAETAGFAQAAGLDDDEAAGLRDAKPDELRAAAEGCVARLSHGLVEATAAQARAVGVRDAARKRADDAATLREQVTQYRAALEKRQRLAEAAETVAADRHLVGLLHARARIADVLAAGRAAEAQLAGIEWDRGRAGDQAAEWARRAEAARLEASRLTDLAELELGLPQREAELAELTGAATRLAGEVEELSGEVDARPELRGQLVTRLQEAATAADSLPGLDERVSGCQRRVDEHAWCAAQAREVDELDQAVREASAAATAAIAHESDLRRRRILGLSGELAESLLDGQPCPVCGAIEHPAPARTSPDHPSAADVGAAERDRAEAERHANAVGTRLTAARAELETRRAPLAGETPDQAGQLLAEANAARDAARKLAGGRDDLAERLGSFDGQTAELSDRLTRLRERLATHQAQARAEQAAIERDRRRIRDAAGEFDSIAELLRHLHTQGMDADQFAGALRQVQASDEAQQREGLVGQLDELAGYGDGDAALIDKRLTEHDEALVTVEAELTRLDGVGEVLAAGADTEAEAAARAAELQAAEAELAAAQGRLGAAEQRHIAAATALERLRSCVGRFQREAKRQAPIQRVADIATATGQDNAKKITLSSFVLMRRFEDVLAAANERLRTMLDGRFELAHTEERSGNRKGGLDIAIVDHINDKQRAVSTLSGGETFCVSLALALGLADVVRGEAGGVELNSLFIDEGFGSLSPDALEPVIAELTRLRDGGRVVGVVSHVEALKTAIPERIAVRRRPDGTSTLQCFANQG